MNQLQVVQENLPQSANEIKAQVNLIQEVMQKVMIKDTHYGTIPGCKQPSLYKPGAEKIMATFRLSADPDITDLSGPDECRYLIKVRLVSPSGAYVGTGVGECSSDEEKYKWRRTYIKQEFDATPDDRKRMKWTQYKGKEAFTEMQIRTSVADQRNTVLKMAKKRALIDAVLTATAASDIFTQDLEDLPEADTATPQQAQPKAKTETVQQEGPLLPPQLKLVKAMIAKTGKTEEEICKAFKVDAVEALPASRINEIIDTINA